MGKPLKFQTVKELEDKIQAYFDECESKSYIDNNGVLHTYPLTITGLALALGTNRQVLMDYQARDDYADTIKMAKTRVEHFAETRIFGTAPTGAIFALKNYGWKDTQDVNLGGQKDNPLNITDEQRNARILELTNKLRTTGTIGTTGSGEASPDTDEPA